MFSESQKSAYKSLWFFLRGYKIQILKVGFVMIISGALEALNLAALYPIMNYGLGQEPKGRLFELLNQFLSYGSSTNQFRNSCILLICVTILATAVKLLNYYCSNKFVKIVSEDTGEAIFEKLSQASYGYYTQNKQGHLIYACTTARQGVTNTVFFISRLINSIIITLSFIFCLALMSWQATFLLLMVGVLYFLLIKKVVSYVISHSAKSAVQAGREINVILNEFINGIKPIRVFQVFQFWKSKFSFAIEKHASNNLKVLIGKSIPEPAIKGTLFLLVACAGFFYSFSAREDVISILPSFGTFMIFVSRLFPSFNLIGSDVLAVARDLPDVQVAYNILNEKIEKQESGRIHIKDFKEAIKFDGVYFQHDGTADYLLKDISFQIPVRKVTAIVGPSGTGKTTIANLLLKLFNVSQGRILIDGIDIREVDDLSYLSMVGFVEQEPFIFNGSIYDNIQFGRAQFGFDHVQKAARLANAEEFILEKPEGYKTIVGDKGAKLSGGQKQRLALARAVLAEPKILILDEATSSLDNISERMIQESIDKICQQTTMLVIAHRLSTVYRADNIIVLERGTIVEQGTHQDLLLKRKKYFELYETALKK